MLEWSLSDADGRGEEVSQLGEWEIEEMGNGKWEMGKGEAD